MAGGKNCRGHRGAGEYCYKIISNPYCNVYSAGWKLKIPVDFFVTARFGWICRCCQPLMTSAHQNTRPGLDSIWCKAEGGWRRLAGWREQGAAVRAGWSWPRPSSRRQSLHAEHRADDSFGTQRSRSLTHGPERSGFIGGSGGRLHWRQPGHQHGSFFDLRRTTSSASIFGTTTGTTSSTSSSLQMSNKINIYKYLQHYLQRQEISNIIYNIKDIKSPRTSSVEGRLVDVRLNRGTIVK